MNVHGKLFRSGFLTKEDLSKALKESTLYVDKDFYEEYSKRKAEMQHIALCAKSFIIENWQKIKSWEGLNVTILDNSGKHTKYFNYKPRPKGRGLKSDAFDRLFENLKKEHYPIKTFEAFLDTSDEDFSVTLNGKKHLWIDDESVIVIAEFIEKTLK